MRSQRVLWSGNPVWSFAINLWNIKEKTMEEVRRASFSLFQFHSKSPRSSFSISPQDAKSRSARASFSRSPRGSTVAIDEALMNIDWTPCLGGSRYSINRSSFSKSPTTPVLSTPIPTTPLPQEIIINIEDTGIYCCTFVFVCRTPFCSVLSR